MSHWDIAKEFHFEYGHRVHSQSLDSTYSLDSKCACRHLHGHSGKINIFLTSKVLTNGMVTDFKHLNWFKKFIDDNLDHKMILDINDPYLDDQLAALKLTRESLYTYGGGYLAVSDIVLNQMRSSASFGASHRVEVAEGLVVVPFVPTSENLCEWFHHIVQDRMNDLGITVSRVQFFETVKSQSNFTED